VSPRASTWFRPGAENGIMLAVRVYPHCAERRLFMEIKRISSGKPRAIGYDARA
jgi:hypothetical protein